MAAINAPFSITYAITDNFKSPNGQRLIEAKNHNLPLSLQRKLFENQIANMTDFITRFKSSLTLSAENQHARHLERGLRETCASLSDWADILGKFYVMKTLNPFTYPAIAADEYLQDFITNYKAFLNSQEKIARKAGEREIGIKYDPSHANSLIAEVAQNCFRLRKHSMSPEHLSEGFDLLRNISQESPRRDRRAESPRRLRRSDIDEIP